MTTRRARLLVRKAHFWLGLGLGSFFVLLGLTGSALVFYQGIDALLHPRIQVQAVGPAPGWDSAVWDRALATVRSRWPERAGPWRFEATGEPGALPARYEAHGHHGRRVMVWLSPDGGTVLREEDWGAYLMTFLYNLHMELALGETGHAAVGWIGLACAVLLLTGLWAWWPRGSWRKALRFKRAAAPSRKLRDLHKLAGLAGLPLLLMLALTGAMLALPGPGNAAMAPLLGPAEAGPDPRSAAAEGPQISIGAALAAAHGALPEARLAWVQAPPPGDGAFMIRVQQPGDPSYRFPRSFVFVDQHDGCVLAVRDSRKATRAATVNNWLHPLHDGSIGGLGFRIVLVLVGMIPAVLFVTGLLRWRSRAR